MTMEKKWSHYSIPETCWWVLKQGDHTGGDENGWITQLRIYFDKID